MFKSIRWSLLFWYGLILVVILTGFGATLYHNLGQAMQEQLDTRLRDHSRTLYIAMAPSRHGRPGEGRPGEARPGETRPGETRPGEFRNPEEVARRFRKSDPDAPYYVVWDARGGVLAQSNPAIAVPMPSLLPPTGPARGLHPDPGPPSKVEGRRHHERGEGPQFRDRGPRRELFWHGPRGTTILVGERSDDEARRLAEFLGMVLAAGLGTLGLALVGGWFLAGRALAPIERISLAASGISASNLSRRIDVEKTESELGRLATILNVTFDRLEAAFLRQVQFTADASHELRTPLSIVISHADLALRRERSAAEYRGTIETCLKAARRMESVVAGLLTLARADAGALNLRRDRVALSALVEDGVALLRALASPRRVTLEVTAEEVDVEGDEERLREVITNLVTNAILYNHEGGTVSIDVGREGALATIRVADTGIGIPERDQPHVFDRFYRADTARSRDLGGNGLGLAIARWVVEAHGGTIAVMSREGQGSTFTVTLPAIANLPAAFEAIAREDPRPAPAIAEAP